MTIYDKFQLLDIDFSAIGLIRRDDDKGYFCTPKGAEIIGWAGVDGIHYCFIPSFGETVFAVSPMNGSGEYVHPLAHDFEDFLRLLLACRDLAAMEQAWQWEEKEFYRFLEEIRLTQKQEEIFELLRNTFSLAPMENPFAYIKALQTGFDYDRILYTKEYYETIGEPFPEETESAQWKVYYEGGFWKHRGRDRAGTEIPLNRQFVWEDEIWHIPAVYSCGAGLAVDFCVEIKPETIRGFMEKWSLDTDEDAERLSPDERRQMEQENPLNPRFHAILTVNGKPTRQKHGCSITWMPPALLAEGMENTPESKAVLAHYGLDESRGWSIHRVSFPWTTKKKPTLRSVSVKLEPGMIFLFGPQFTSPAVGEKIRFTHPVTGVEHTLTVEEYTKQEMNRGGLPEDMEFPTYYTMMVYSVTPVLSDMDFSVCDCESNELPRRKPDGTAPSFGGACVGIIGGADGPTAIFFSQRHMDKPHAACSALRFEPAESIVWRMIFRVKKRTSLETELI